MESKEVSDMTQDEFHRGDYLRKWKDGFVVFTVYGYTIDELKEIIDFAKLHGWVKGGS